MLPVPPVMLYVSVWPSSTSVATTVSTGVVSTLFSAMVKVWAATTGASLTSVRLIVMVLVSIPVPSFALTT